MAVQIVNRAYFIIDGEEFECKTCSSKGEMDGHDSIKVMNKQNRAIGFKSGVPVFDLSAEIPLPVGGHAFDFYDMMVNQTLFTVIIEFQDEESESYYDAVIKSVERTPTSGEEITTKLEIAALDFGTN